MTRTCKFCGQVVETYNDSREGWQVCNCQDAQRERKLIDRMEEAEQIVDMLFYSTEDDCGFDPVPDTTLNFLQIAAGKCLQGDIDSAVINLPDGSRAALKVTADGALDIQRSKRKRIGHQTK